MIKDKTYIVKSSGMPIMPVHPADVNAGNIKDMLAQVKRPAKGDTLKCLEARSDKKNGWFYLVETKDGKGWVAGSAVLKYEVEEAKDAK